MSVWLEWNGLFHSYSFHHWWAASSCPMGAWPDQTITRNDSIPIPRCSHRPGLTNTDPHHHHKSSHAWFLHHDHRKGQAKASPPMTDNSERVSIHRPTLRPKLVAFNAQQKRMLSIRKKRNTSKKEKLHIKDRMRIPLGRELPSPPTHKQSQAKKTNKQTDRQTDKQTDKRSDRQTNKQIKKTKKYIKKKKWIKRLLLNTNNGLELETQGF